MKSRAVLVYRKIKKSSVWRENQTAAFFYPSLRLAVKSLIVLYLLGRWTKHRSKFVKHHGRRFLRSKIKIKNKRVKKDTRFEDLRNAIQKRKWGVAIKLCTSLMESDKTHPLKPLIKNEVKMNLSLISRIIHIDDYKTKIKEYNKKKGQPKIAIFTAISGNYDTLKLPQVLNPNFDYILFTDSPARGSGIFQIKPMPYFNQDATRQARFVKTHPHQLLQGYDFAVWIDANVMILEDIMPMFEKFVASKKPVGAIQHPYSNSVHEEAQRCLKYNKEDASLLRQQVKHYEKLGFESNDIIESNLIMFDLRNKRLNNFFTTWWAEIEAYTKRDQMSLPYALHANKISWHRLMKRPYDARSHRSLAWAPHLVRETAITELEKKLGSDENSPFEGPSFYKHKSQLLANKTLDKKKIDIIYCVHNALEDVKICLDSVAKNHAKNERLIIIDDGSDEDTKTFLESFAKKHKTWTKIIRTETGSGYTKAANRGLRASTGDLMILLNSDTIVTSNWTRKMAQAVYTTPGAGLVGPLSSAAGYQSIPEYNTDPTKPPKNSFPPGITAEDMNIYCERWSIAGIMPLVPLLHGFCLGIRREVIDTIGYFDEENFPFGYGEEDDYCCRVINAGFNLVIATNTYIFHAKAKSYSNDERRAQLMKMGRKAKHRKWGEERFGRAVKTMQQNPLLKKVRQKARDLYDSDH